MTDNYLNGELRHLGLIPDGNRRYARAGGLPVGQGHAMGAKKLREVLSWCLGHPEIRQISVFCLSLDNLKRPMREMDALWKIYEEEFRKIPSDPFVRDNGIKVNILGNRKVWPKSIIELVEAVMESTLNYSSRVLNLLLAYSSKFELGRTVLDRTNLEDRLIVKEPVNLLVRTGNQYRLSGFLPYQCSYAEIWFERKLWPEVTKGDFEGWVRFYYEQRKKFGA